ncbi:thrombospondin type 3 repeat-containing protein [Leptospira meyeri]|uniref:thrombospondin type 3 repeat-containing protein n=2 Tax=Leptospira meyeri TaxID=29508 RepID=UPI000C29FC2A|nr:thrombospondin type 3 repeat-containing protein [Leptospira meyeri]PJZ79883.1 hypothetical protein CH359_15245 [Leptospira meyeri]PJZ96158.1 hypothetical protein CH358_14665 [Leptospira meyeri]
MPRLLGRSQVPVGKIYDISLDLKKKGGNESLSYKSLYFAKPVELEFPVDLEGLESKGFTNEFYVWYKDFTTNEWKVLQKGVLDQNSSSVKVQTNHFTPFILSALPYLPGTEIAAASSCFTTESASWNLQGILDDSSVSQAKFGIIGEGYRYYQDRPYFVKEEEGAFRELGLEFALLVPTCQGGTGTCGNSLLHSESTSAEYLAFDAAKNIDVYVMYDTRGGISPADTSQDADWLADFSLLTGKYIYTTEPGLDPAQTVGASGYKIYKKTFPQGARVSLGGNKKGTIASGISSNYWVVVKPAGIEGGVQPAATLCVAGPDPREPDVVTGRTYPGSDRILFWLGYPPINGPKKIIIRRSEISPPMSPTSGEEPNGTEITPYSYLDTGLVEGHTYYYSIFAVNDDGMYSGITIGMETTGPDTDGDGLTDSVEINTGFTFSPSINVYPPLFYRATNPDCDGDGINDGMEIAHGTNPCSNGDSTPPVVTVSDYSQNASSGIIDLNVRVVDGENNHLMSFCYIRQFTPGMTEEEFLRKPFSLDLYSPAIYQRESLDRWIYYCENPQIFSYSLGKLGGGMPDRFAIWGKDSYGNISEPVLREYKVREIKTENTLMVNPIVLRNNSGFHIFTLSFDLIKDWNGTFPDLLDGLTHTSLYDTENNLISKKGHVIPVKYMPSYYTVDQYGLPGFITLSTNVASYYEPRNTPGQGQNFVKKNDVPIDYQFTEALPQAVHFATQLGTDTGFTALYSGSTNLQQSVFKIEGGYLSAFSSSLPGVPAGFYPKSILPYDFGQGFGLLNGNQFQDYTLDSLTSPSYQAFGTGIIDSNFSDVISIDKLNRYNPQNEAETYAVLKSTSPTDLKILFRNSGDLNFTSIPVTGIPNGFIGLQTMFVSYKDFSGTPVYHLYLHGHKTIQNNGATLIRFRISSSGGIPTFTFDRELFLHPNYRNERIFFDNSGRYLIATAGYNDIISVYLMTEQDPLLVYQIKRTQMGGIPVQLAFIPKEPVNVDNIGGYSKIRLIQTAGYTDYQRYGFLPAGSELIFRNHVYDSKSNECTSPSVPGTANVIATSTGNYGVPPIPLAVVNDNLTIQNAHKVQAPSSAATLVIESTYTQSSNACKTGLVANDTASIPVRTKVVQNTTSVYKDYSLNPASVPSTYNTAPAPANYETADFKKWEPLSKSSPQRLGIYIRKVIYVWWPYIAVIDEGNPCILGDITVSEGQQICNIYFGGYPFYYEDFVYPYDKYTFTGQYVYSGDKLIQAP